MIMRFYLKKKLFGLSTMFIFRIANACLREMRDVELVKIQPEDLDFVKFRNFKITKGNVIKQPHRYFNEIFIRYFCSDTLNIAITVPKKANTDPLMINLQLNSIVKIAKEYISINLHGIKCSRAYKRVFLGCALHYGIANYKLNNFTVMADNNCVDAVLEIRSFPKKTNKYSVLLDADFIFNIYYDLGTLKSAILS